ncbi:hypothetical protein DL96DRAFT_1603875 [Flagelloscypha sp. PMI_526]|nr:hypothetical protein DL96DRAFT_1603875 [Flagelloscypha sp. PMI_526]
MTGVAELSAAIATLNLVERVARLAYTYTPGKRHKLALLSVDEAYRLLHEGCDFIPLPVRKQLLDDWQEAEDLARSMAEEHNFTAITSLLHPRKIKLALKEYNTMKGLIQRTQETSSNYKKLVAYTQEAKHDFDGAENIRQYREKERQAADSTPTPHKLTFKDLSTAPSQPILTLDFDKPSKFSDEILIRYQEDGGITAELIEVDAGERSSDEETSDTSSEPATPDIDEDDMLICIPRSYLFNAPT